MSNNKFNGDRRIQNQNNGVPRHAQIKFTNMKPFTARLGMSTLTDLMQRNYMNSQMSSLPRQNALMYRSQKFLFNTFYELESQI